MIIYFSVYIMLIHLQYLKSLILDIHLFWNMKLNMFHV